jgi:hypothetical protein
MKKSAAALGTALAVMSLGFGLVGCGSDSKSNKTTTSTPTSTSAKTTTTTTSAQASGPNETLADYIEKNNIQTATISRGTAGAPDIYLPPVDGWTIQPETPNGPYGELKLNSPTDPSDPPMIVALLEKWSGNVNTDEVLAVAGGEVKNLPGYDGNDGQRSTLSGFPAFEVGGTYTKNGKPRVAAQKTVVIESPNGFYILQLNAEGPDTDVAAVANAADAIDKEAKITV